MNIITAEYQKCDVYFISYICEIPRRIERGGTQNYNLRNTSHDATESFQQNSFSLFIEIASSQESN